MYFILQHNWGYEGLQDNFYKSYFEARGDGEGDSCFYVCGNGCACSGSASGSFCF